MCLDKPSLDGAVVTPSCAHVFCRGCLTSALNEGVTARRRRRAAKTERGRGESSYREAGADADADRSRPSFLYEDGECPLCGALVEASRIITLSSARSSGDGKAGAGRLQNRIIAASVAGEEIHCRGGRFIELELLEGHAPPRPRGRNVLRQDRHCPDRIGSRVDRQSGSTSSRLP